MKVRTLKKSQLVKKPLDEVFDFFSSPENLARITPPEMGFNIITPGPIEMKPGALIDYTVRVSGIPVRWTTLITEFDPPHKFVDVQLKGPYQFWHHTHTFKQIGEETLIDDEIKYMLPFGFLGDIVHALSVRGQLEKIFNYRYKIIAKHFAADEPDETAGK